MKKALFILAVSAFASTSFGLLEVNSDMTWTTPPDSVQFNGDYTLTRAGNRDLSNGTYFDVGSHNATFSFQPTASASTTLAMYGTNSIKGTGGTFNLNVVDNGGEYFAKLSIANIAVDNATFNFTATDRNFVTQATTSKILLSNGAIANLTNFSGQNNGTNAITLYSEASKGTFNLLGNTSEYKNVYMSGASGTVNTVYLKSSATNVSFIYDGTSSGSFMRTNLYAEGKNLSLNSSVDLTMTAQNFRDFQKVVLEGSGLYNLNTTRFYGKANSTVEINSNSIWQGTITFDNAVATVATNASLQFGSNSTNHMVIQAKTLTVNGTAGSYTDILLKGSGYFSVADNATVEMNRELRNSSGAAMWLNKNSTLSLNADSTINNAVFWVKGNSTFGVGADIDLLGFDFSEVTAGTANTSKLTLSFAKGATLDVQSFSNLVDASVYIEGEVYRQFKVFDVEIENGEVSDSFKSKFTSSTGEVFFEHIAGNEYYINTVIPEPAEWAAILGALALGFAIRRKRR